MEHFCYFLFRVCHAFLSVHCSLVVTNWERTSLLALICDVLMCFCHFPVWCLGQVWYLFLSIPDLCLLTYIKQINDREWIHGF